MTFNYIPQLIMYSLSEYSLLVSLGTWVGLSYCFIVINQLISVLWAFQFDYSIILFRISAAAASTLEELKTQTRAGLEHSISQRKVRD